MQWIEKIMTRMLKKADITVNGNRPWDIQVHNPVFFRRLLLHGSIALGESYVDGWWDCEQVDQCIYRVLRSGIVNRRTYCFEHSGSSLLNILRPLFRTWTTNHSKKKCANDVRYHYNLGNDLFEATLDSYMNYSCAYWKHAHSLDEAQQHKMAMICEKLQLETGMRVLEIGCEWGGLAKYMADNHKVHVTGITLSENQATYAKQYCKGSDVDIVVQDYRDTVGMYDRIVSIEMIEHVGIEHLRTYMKKIYDCLTPDGIVLLQFDGKSESVNWNYKWIEKYVFPGTVTPSPKQLTTAMEGFLSIVDWHDFTKDYHKTMIEWHKNFTKHWPRIQKNYDERFYRLWEFYLLCCPATALANTQRLWQVICIREGSDRDYRRLEPPTGIEPVTHRLQGGCSTS